MHLGCQLILAPTNSTLHDDPRSDWHMRLESFSILYEISTVQSEFILATNQLMRHD